MSNAAMDAPASTAAAFTPEVQTRPSAVNRRCPNCETDALGDFCHACGGRVVVSRLTLRALAGEVMAQLIELDHGVLHTVVELVRRPGQTIRGYFDGRRRGLTSPLTFVALSVALTLLLTSLMPDFKAAHEAQLEGLAGYRPLYSAKQFEMFVAIEHAATEGKALLLALLLIPTTLTMRFLFRKHRLNLAETGAVVCYLYGVSTFVMLPLAVAVALAGQAKLESTLAMISMVGFLLHLAFGVYGRSFSTAWRAVWAGVLGLLLMQVGLILAPFVLAH